MTATYRPTLQPKAHQLLSIAEHAASTKANFDDQGLGKCKQAYDLAGKLIAEKTIDLMIMVSKASLRENFLKEVKKDASQLVAKIVGGTRTERNLNYLYPSAHILLLSYETVILDLDILKEVMIKNRVLLCLDEGHYIKNPKSRRSLACVELSTLAQKAIVFTGTPAPNSPNDLYPQLKFLGLDVGETIDDFKRRFRDLDTLRQFVKQNSIRRRKMEVLDLNLPAKFIHTIKVARTAEEIVAYSSIADELLMNIKSSIHGRSTIKIKNVLSKFVRLLQVSSNHRIIDLDIESEPSKLLALDKLVNEQVLEKGKKLIIWTSYQKNVRELQARYAKFSPVSLYGPDGRKQITLNAKAFQEDPNVKILVAIPACAREGFTLTTAHTAVYLDRSFSYLDWAQSQDRIHRISQTEECHIYVLEAAGTIDERIDELLQRKGHKQAYILGDVAEYLGDEEVSLEQIETLVNG